MNEKDVNIMNINNLVGGRSDKDWDEILNNDLNNLISQGWFKRGEVVPSDKNHKTFINRKGISNKYSFVTLQLMAEEFNLLYLGSIKDSIFTTYPVVNGDGGYGLNLHHLKKRLKAQIDGEVEMKYYTLKEIEVLRRSLNLKIPKDVKTFNRKVNDHNMLAILRNKYLHWNSNFSNSVGAYEPEYTIEGKQLIRKRAVEPNS